MLGADFGLTGLPARKGSDATITRLVLSGFSVPENASTGTVVATLTVVGPGYLAPAAFTLTSDPGNNFEVVGNELRVKTGAALDFETEAFHLISISAMDANPTVYTRDTGIAVTNVNEQPTDITLSANSIPENAQPGSIIGTLSTTDVDAGDTFTYSIETDTDARFAISGNNLTVRTGASFDFETATSHNVTVRSTDAGGLFTTKPFTINVTNLNEVPTDIALSAATISDADPDGTVVGVISSADPDAGDTATYSIAPAGDPSGNFEIVGLSLQTTVGNTLDNAVNASHSITLRVTDSGGLVFDKAFVITVTSGVSAFLPTDLTVMPEWYKGDTGIIIGTGVQTWEDQGTNGNDLTQAIGAKQPTHNVAGGYISFDAVGDSLSVTGVLVSGTDVHVFLVAKVFDDVGTFKRIVTNTTSSNDHSVASKPILLLSRSTSPATELITYGGGQRAATTGTAIDNTTKLIHSGVVGGLSTIKINKVISGTTGTFGTPLTLLDLCIGSGNPTWTGARMDMYELVYVRGAMTAQEITDMEDYLTTRHGL